MKIIVMAKAPEPGRVKTRLCPPLKYEQAAALAAAALADTLHAVVACGAAQRWVALDGRPGDWLPEGFRVIPQVGTGFNERLANAWNAVGGPALQIGMDTPQVSSGMLDEGMAMLDRRSRAVLGPATDGGWWAIGLHRADAKVFDGIPMSTPETGRLQGERLTALGLDPRFLPALSDVDVWDDAVRVAQLAPRGRFAAAVRSFASGAGPIGLGLGHGDSVECR